MHKFPPHFWLAVFCAVLSGGLWIWSSRLPNAAWESSTAVALPSPDVSGVTASPFLSAQGPEPTPIPTMSEPSPVATQVPEPAPAATEIQVSIPTPTPAESSAPVADASPMPSPTPETITEIISAVPPVPSPAAETVVPTPSPTSTPPSDAELAGPMPVHSANESAAAAVSQSTPVPLTVADIARQPKLWPRQLFLLTSVRFPVVLNGVNVGNVQVPAGSAVVLRKVNSEGTVEVELRGSLATVKAESTDLVARARTLVAAPPSIGH